YVLVFARDDCLQTHDRARIPHNVVARATTPGEIIGEVILMQTIAPQRELEVLLKKYAPVAKRSLAAKNSVVGAGAQCQIVPMNTARRRSLHLHFIELLFEPAAIASGEFHPTNEHCGESEIGLVHEHARRLRIIEI